MRTQFGGMRHAIIVAATMAAGTAVAQIYTCRGGGAHDGLAGASNGTALLNEGPALMFTGENTTTNGSRPDDNAIAIGGNLTTAANESSLTGVRSETTVIQIDMAAAGNWDGYISSAEQTEALSYNPPSDWGLGGRMVKNVFGEHSFPQWSWGNRVFAWQAQVGASYVGLPDDGKITAGNWDYQLATHLDAEPSEGWGNPEYPKGTNPNGLLPLARNVIYVYRPHTGTADPATANYTTTLSAAEQGYYTGLNMLMFGNAAANREMRIYAVYEDGEELLWTGNVPSPQQPLDPETYPSHADLDVAYTTGRVWYNVGSPPYDSLKTETASVYQFSEGLSLEPGRKLEGVRFHFVPKTWAAADFTVMAIALTPSGTDYYVDPVNGSMNNPGTADAPWSTLQAVFAAGKTFQPGDTIYLRSGNHGFPQIRGRNSGNVTIVRQEGHSPRATRLLFDQAERWVLDGLTINPEATPPYSSISMLAINTNSSRITVRHCDVFSFADVSSWDDAAWRTNTWNGILINGTQCDVHHNTIRHVSSGIQERSSNNRVAYNEVNLFRGDGLRGLGNYSVFEYNLIRNNVKVDDNHDDGFQSWSIGADGQVGTGTVYGVVLRGNVIIENDIPDRPYQGPLQGIGCFDGFYEDWTVENNIVIVDQWHGISFYGAVNCRVVNNTVVRRGIRTNTPWIRVGDHKSLGPGRGNLAVNNIAHSFTWGSNEGGLISNNLAVTLSQYPTYFVDAVGGDVHLKAQSPAIDAGIQVAGVPATDIEGNARPTGDAVDVGAYEFQP